MNQQDIEQVVKAVLLKMQSSDTPSAAVHEMGVFASLDDAVAAAKVAQQGLKSVAMRQLAIAAIREAGEKHARDLAELAVSETGMGRVEDKFAKNVAQARGTPGVECLSPQVLTGDNGLTLIENAPWGVVASVTPSTNPAATVINNAISLIAAGNSVIFAPHPAAKKVSQRAITLLSGGEKAFVAIALYFAILKLRPTPFCVLDEIEAALDDVNVQRFAKYIRRLTDSTQFIVITHRRGTMEEADMLYGVTMQEQGVSKMLMLNLAEAEKRLKNTIK